MFVDEDFLIIRFLSIGTIFLFTQAWMFFFFFFWKRKMVLNVKKILIDYFCHICMQFLCRSKFCTFIHCLVPIIHWYNLQKTFVLVLSFHLGRARDRGQRYFVHVPRLMLLMNPFPNKKIIVSNHRAPIINKMGSEEIGFLGHSLLKSAIQFPLP